MILNKKNPETIQMVSSLIRNGAVAILPCDTIYGLCASYRLGEKPLKELKGRDSTKPFLVLATVDMAKSLCSSIPKDILDTWPAPLTVLLSAKDGGKIGIRVPDDAFLQKLLESTGEPIFSTSVNMSGEPSLLDLDAICNRFEAFVDVIVRDREVQGTVPSTVLDATERPYRIVRQGLFDASFLITKSGLS